MVRQSITGKLLQKFGNFGRTITLAKPRSIKTAKWEKFPCDVDLTG
jgi:hypothetical protein